MQQSQVKINTPNTPLYPVDIINIFENLAQHTWNIGVKGGLPCKGYTKETSLPGLIIFFVSKKVLDSIDKIFGGNTHTALVDIGMKAFGIPLMLKAHDSDINIFVGTVYMERPTPESPLQKVDQKQFSHPYFETIAHYKNHVTRDDLITSALNSMSHLAV